MRFERSIINGVLIELQKKKKLSSRNVNNLLAIVFIIEHKKCKRRYSAILGATKKVLSKY